jgi:hypothetical protein
MTTTATNLLAAYQHAVDAKYELEEGTALWRKLDVICDELCHAYVTASHAEKGEG